MLVCKWLGKCRHRYGDHGNRLTDPALVARILSALHGWFIHLHGTSHDFLGCILSLGYGLFIRRDFGRD